MTPKMKDLEGPQRGLSTERVKKVTESLGKAKDLHWRYDLVSSRRFPVQYYATALRGSGADADEIVVIGIECFESDTGHLTVSASITGEDGVILAESSATEIEFPSELQEAMGTTTRQIQEAFDSLVTWVHARQDVIQTALAQA